MLFSVMFILQAVCEYSIAPQYLNTYQKAIANINRSRQDNPMFDDVIKVRVFNFSYWIDKQYEQRQMLHNLAATELWNDSFISFIL